MIMPTKQTQNRPATSDVAYLRILNASLSVMATNAADPALFTTLMNVCTSLEYGKLDRAIENLKDLQRDY